MGHLDLIKTWCKVNELVDTKTNLKIEINDATHLTSSEIAINTARDRVH